jgi:hypothetical protein
VYLVLQKEYCQRRCHALLSLPTYRLACRSLELRGGCANTLGRRERWEARVPAPAQLTVLESGALRPSVRPHEDGLTHLAVPPALLCVMHLRYVHHRPHCRSIDPQPQRVHLPARPLSDSLVLFYALYCPVYQTAPNALAISTVLSLMPQYAITWPGNGYFLFNSYRPPRAVDGFHAFACLPDQAADQTEKI